MRSFDAFGWMRYINYNLTAPGEPRFLNGIGVTPALANSLGVNPKLGRWFRDFADGPVAVISNGLWLRLGADAAMVGKTITLSGIMYTVTGVMPPGFDLPLAGTRDETQTDVWVPLDPSGAGQEDRDSGDNFCYARLRPGVTVAQADAEAKRIAREIAHREPATRQNYTAHVDGIRDLTTRDIKPILWLLFGAALLLLLITCANVGGLLLARSVARARETAVRVALGAGLRQLAQQYFLEGLLVSLPGAAGGLLFGFALVRVLVGFGSAVTTRVDEVAMDWPVMGFAIAAAFVACALPSLAPLWQGGRARLPTELIERRGARAGGGEGALPTGGGVGGGRPPRRQMTCGGRAWGPRRGRAAGGYRDRSWWRK